MHEKNGPNILVDDMTLWRVDTAPSISVTALICYTVSRSRCEYSECRALYEKCSKYSCFCQLFENSRIYCSVQLCIRKIQQTIPKSRWCDLSAHCLITNLVNKSFNSIKSVKKLANYKYFIPCCRIRIGLRVGHSSRRASILC